MPARKEPFVFDDDTDDFEDDLCPAPKQSKSRANAWERNEQCDMEKAMKLSLESAEAEVDEIGTASTMKLSPSLLLDGVVADDQVDILPERSASKRKAKQRVEKFDFGNVESKLDDDESEYEGSHFKSKTSNKKPKKGSKQPLPLPPVSTNSTTRSRKKPISVTEESPVIITTIVSKTKAKVSTIPNTTKPTDDSIQDPLGELTDLSDDEISKSTVLLLPPPPPQKIVIPIKSERSNRLEISVQSKKENQPLIVSVETESNTTKRKPLMMIETIAVKREENLSAVKPIKKEPVKKTKRAKVKDSDNDDNAFESTSVHSDDESDTHHVSPDKHSRKSKVKVTVKKTSAQSTKGVTKTTPIQEEERSTNSDIEMPTRSDSDDKVERSAIPIITPQFKAAPISTRIKSKLTTELITPSKTPLSAVRSTNITTTPVSSGLLSISHTSVSGGGAYSAGVRVGLSRNARPTKSLHSYLQQSA